MGPDDWWPDDHLHCYIVGCILLMPRGGVLCVFVVLELRQVSTEWTLGAHGLGTRQCPTLRCGYSWLIGDEKDIRAATSLRLPELGIGYDGYGPQPHCVKPICSWLPYLSKKKTNFQRKKLTNSAFFRQNEFPSRSFHRWGLWGCGAGGVVSCHRTVSCRRRVFHNRRNRRSVVWFHRFLF